MCLVLIAWQVHDDFPLVVAANRDEFYSRRTAAASFWQEAPHVLAGRDLEAGGTWLGVSRRGRFAALTNYRAGSTQDPLASSRGHLVADFLAGKEDPHGFLAGVRERAGQYNGFNLFVGDDGALGYFSNRGPASPAWLSPGIYGLSNHLLDTPWPKLASAKERFANALSLLPDTEPFFDLLADREIVPDASLPATGVPIEWERILSAVFVTSEGYGTRAATVICRHCAGQISLLERTFGPDARPIEAVAESFQSSLTITSA